MRLLSIILVLVFSVTTFAQAPPWPSVLGARMHLCQKNRPIVSRVVLVPDADTWLEEVGRWSMAGQWPVLFESDPHADEFIRGFRPEEILRVPPTERRLPVDADQRKVRMLQVVRAAWNTPPERRVIEAFAQIGWEPPGFAVASPKDPAWPAAVAIAAARGVPLVFIDEDLGPVDGVMDGATLAGLESALQHAATRIAEDTDRAIEARLSTLDPKDRPIRKPSTWRKTGDLLDAVAICRAMPGRVRYLPPVAARVPKVREVDKPDGPFATTDALCRLEDGERWGYAGWIWGNEARAANMAMSSIFLERRNLWFISGYGDGPQWRNFAVEEAAVKMTELGYASIFIEGEGADLDGWRKMLRGGIRPDVLYLNSHGNPSEFHLFRDERARPTDVPFLERPMALSLTHSFSLQRPNDANTVGGRFLQRGVYAYLGSVDEPYLAAFVPPRLQSLRLAAGVPFLLAGRLWPGESPMSGVWKVTAIGDPFMVALQPGFREVSLVPLDRAPGVPDAESLVEVAKDAIRAIRDDPMQASEAIRLLELTNRDDLAIDTWDLIQASGDRAISAAARSILGPLFRAGRWQAFVLAYERLPLEERDAEARDMLWHLLTPRLSGIRDPDILMLLEGETRPPFDVEDMEILVPHLDRVLGGGRGRAALQRRIEAEADPSRRARWQRLVPTASAF